ncbi:hypothetical protein KIN13_18360, partial [Vibrio cholerae]
APMKTIKQTATYMTWERKLRDQRAKAIIAARVFRVANGLLGDVEPVGQGVSELRIHYGPGYRVYFQQRGNELVLLLGDILDHRHHMPPGVGLGL